MKPILIFLSLLLLSGVANAQQQFQSIDDDLVYAVIKDTDGYVNVRHDPSVNAPILGKIYNYSVFNCEPNGTNWWKVLQMGTENGSSLLEGYIYKDKVSLLKNWKTVIIKKGFADSAVFKNDSLTIIVKKRVFRFKQHKLFYHKGNPNENTASYLEKIDGKRFWGTDGEIPRNVISSIKLIDNRAPIVIPEEAFKDLYEPNLQTLSFCSDAQNIFYVRMNNSDGAGAYTIIWVIKDNKYLKRYIDTSND
jgi:hypothetical protein